MDMNQHGELFGTGVGGGRTALPLRHRAMGEGLREIA